MNNYKKIYLLSDIHGYVEGLEQASLVACKQTPLYVLGDLFDHKFGYESRIAELILSMIEEQRCFLILGNHDEFTFNLFQTCGNFESDYIRLTKTKNLKKYQILIDLFDIDFYSAIIEYREQLIKSAHKEDAVNRYYTKINQLCNTDMYIKQYTNLIKLLSSGQLYIDVIVNDNKILLTHSGDKSNTSSRDSVKDGYKLEESYDVGIMGHLTIPAISKMIEQEGDMISYSNFIDEQPHKQINIEGNYIYNSYSNLILIDDGSHANLVCIS